jgi:acyl-coenzyme A thioesterase PaaI-like protein
MKESSPPGAMTVRQKILTEIAAGTSPIPAYVTRLALDIVALEWREGFVSVSFNIPSDFCVEPNIVFGGHVAGIHDQAAGFVMYSFLADNMMFATTRLYVSYMAATRPGPVNAVATISTPGERVADVRVQLIQEGRVTSESAVTEAMWPLSG